MKILLLLACLFGILASAAIAATDKQPKYSKSIQKTAKLLQQKSHQLQPVVIDKVLKTLHCAKKNKVAHNDILTIIDYSLPSNQKRFWVFDLPKKKLLHHTYVSHGLRSGSREPTFFSNINNSKASSLGVFNTEKKYYGRYGISLKLQGLEKTFNDNAYNRFIVMHGSWYVNEPFIKKYGRAGRSWGCPSLPLTVVKPIINKIKDNAIMVVYYPSDQWLQQSDFIHCDNKVAENKETPQRVEFTPLKKQQENRGDIIYVDENNNQKRDREEAVVVVQADKYQATFNKVPPLKRMLRRQIEKKEYIVLNRDELNQINKNKKNVKLVYYVRPEVKKLRGYYATEMIFVPKSKIKTKPLKSTDKFIRWLGL